MDSSDEDSILDGAPTFSSRKERCEAKKRAQGLEYIDTLQEDAEKRQRYQDNIDRVKQQEGHFENRMEDAEERLTQRAIKQEEEQEPEVEASDELATALDTAQSKPLGMQSTLGPGNEEGQWISEQHAVDYLKQILTKLEANESQSVRNEVLPFFRNAIKHKSLALVLQRGKLAPLCRQHKVLHLPYDLTEWLYSVACNPSAETMNLSTGAFTTLLALWKQVRGHAENPLLLIQSLEKDLEVQYGLRMKENIASNDGSTESSTVNVAGLEHCVLLWEQAFQNDIVPRAHEPACDEADMMKDAATDCMMALCRAGLDPCFYDNPSLHTALSRVLSALLDFVHRRLLYGSDEGFQEWSSTTATKSMEQCRQFGQDYWLSASLMLSLFHNDTPFNKNCQKFKTLLAIRAVQMCLNVDDWDQHLQTTLAKQSNNKVALALAENAGTSLRWQAITSAYVGLLTIPTLGDDFILNVPRCLATIESISHLFLTGINLGSDDAVVPTPQENDDDDDDEEALAPSRIYGSVEEASLLHQVFMLVDTECDPLKGTMRRFSSNPLYGRAEYHLSCLRGCLVQFQKDAGTRAGHKAPTVSVQKSLNQFFSTTTAGSDDEDNE